MTTKDLPPAVRVALREIARDPQMNEGVRAMRTRKDEMGGDLEAMLAGTAAVPAARRHYEKALDAYWKQSRIPQGAPEVVIGSGIHAAIYAATRVAKGFPKPLVIEADRVGGSFAVTMTPSFYLNSRNRPGPLGLPGEAAALNVLPGAPIQPAHLSNSEYQRNSDLAFIIRSTLALNANVVKGRVADVKERTYGRKYKLVLANNSPVNTDRVIVATGLGKPRINVASYDPGNSKRVMDFAAFMRKFDKPFPLRDLGRVAVIGEGDGGKVVIEALTGKGPAEHVSSAELDYPDEIVWFQGGVGVAQTCEAFENQERSRYKSIGRLLQPNSNGQRRVQPQNIAESINGGANVVYVNNRPFDHVVMCFGYANNLSELLLGVRWSGGTPVQMGGINVAKKKDGQPIYIIGPAAQLALEGREGLTKIYSRRENQVAIFRYAERTATLAASFKD